MTSLKDYKNIVSQEVQKEVFRRRSRDVMVSDEFAGVLQQFYILQNWRKLREKIHPEELWAMLKLFEYRSAKLIFDIETGNLLGESSTQEIYKKYYYNSLWLLNEEGSENLIFPKNISTFIAISILLIVIYFVLNIFVGKTRHKVNRKVCVLNLLKVSTRVQ